MNLDEQYFQNKKKSLLNILSNNDFKEIKKNKEIFNDLKDVLLKDKVNFLKDCINVFTKKENKNLEQFLLEEKTADYESIKKAVYESELYSLRKTHIITDSNFAFSQLSKACLLLFNNDKENNSKIFKEYLENKYLTFYVLYKTIYLKEEILKGLSNYNFLDLFNKENHKKYISNEMKLDVSYFDKETEEKLNKIINLSSYKKNNLQHLLISSVNQEFDYYFLKFQDFIFSFNNGFYKRLYENKNKMISFMKTNKNFDISLTEILNEFDKSANIKILDIIKKSVLIDEIKINNKFVKDVLNEINEKNISVDYYSINFNEDIKNKNLKSLLTIYKNLNMYFSKIPPKNRLKDSENKMNIELTIYILKRYMNEVNKTNSDEVFKIFETNFKYLDVEDVKKQIQNYENSEISIFVEKILLNNNFKSNKSSNKINKI